MASPAAEAYIEGDAIVIRVPIENLPIAFEYCPLNPHEPSEAMEKQFRISDLPEFAKSLVRRLNEEEEDGTTLIHRCFDKAMEQVIEQGDEGVSDITEKT